MISSENGAIAAARRAITFLSGRYCSEKCEWAPTLQTLARAHLRPRNLRRPPEQLVPWERLQLKERLLLRRRHHLDLRIRLHQHLPDHLGVRLQ
jgi:hypothetical protein